MTNVGGIQVPSSSPTFLAVVPLHVLLGLASVVSVAAAMSSPKKRGRYPRLGTIHFWCLSGAVALAIGLSVVRWGRDYPLFLLGLLSFTTALFGRTAKRQHWSGWVQWHITGMGGSYVLLLIAFYVDNGKSLPVWRDLPAIRYWLLPAVIGGTLIGRAVLRHRSSVVWKDRNAA